MSQIKESLLAYGLSANEAEIYIFLLRNKDVPAYFIAKETSIPRTTVYKTLESLERQGFVASWTKNGTRHFSAENPDTFRRKLKDKGSELEKSLPVLSEMFSSLSTHPSAKLYVGKEGVKQAFEIMLDVIKTKKLRQIYVYSDSQLTKELPRYFKEWRQRKNRTGAFTHLIVPPGTQMNEDYASDAYRETRILPKQFPFVGSVDICGSSIAFFSFKNKQLHAIVIDSPIIADMMKQFFIYMWDTLEPLSAN